jgi:hypothetical protein
MRVGEVSYFAQEAEGLFGDEGVFGDVKFSGRVEVRNAETENYVPGAAVSLLYGPLDYPEGAGHVKTVLTDAGGNAKFMNMATAIPGERFWYRVSAPGYEAQDIPADSGIIKTVNLVAVGSAKPKGNVPVAALAVGGVVVLGIIGYLAFKG